MLCHRWSKLFGASDSSFFPGSDRYEGRSGNWNQQDLTSGASSSILRADMFHLDNKIQFSFNLVLLKLIFLKVALTMNVIYYLPYRCVMMITFINMTAKHNN
jgi:hypothetical protein